MEIETLEKACQETECGFEIYFLLALAYKNNIEYEKAEKAYLKALEINPKSEKTLFNLASLYLFLNSPENAVKYFKNVLNSTRMIRKFCTFCHLDILG